LENEPVIVDDLRTETRVSGPALLHDHGVISGISVIIRGKSRPWGVLGAHTAKLRHFNKDDAHFVQGVANLLASAIVRLQAEETLRLSRDQLEIILQGVADGITVQGIDGSLVYANNAAARSMGYPNAEDLIKTPVTEITNKFDMLDEEGKPFPLNRLPGRVALTEGNASSATIRFRYPDTGIERWSIVKATPVYNPAGKVEHAINIIQDITELKQTELGQRLLAEVGTLLDTSLDYDSTLAGVAHLAVPILADWCLVDLKENESSIRRIAVAHSNPEKMALAQEFQERYPPDWDAPTGVAAVLRTGKPEFYPVITDDMLVAAAYDEEHLHALRQLGFKSVIVVPLAAQGRILGAITLIWSDSGRCYTQADVDLSMELARRAALAIDYARLFRKAQELNTELENRVARRTSQLQALVNKLRSEVAERRKAEEALRKNEAVLESLFESSPDATVLVDQTGTIVRINSQAEKVFGYQREELVGKLVDLLLPDRYRERHISHRTNYFAEMRTRPMGAGLELYAHRKDGTELPVDVMLSPVVTEAGTLVIGSVRDITERKRMQAELDEVHRRLIDSVEAERIFIAQELHDGPIQDLYVITYQLKAMDGSGPLKEALSQSKETLQHVISMLRSICGDLRPPALAPFGLESAIRAHAEKLAETNPELDVHLDLMTDGQALPERMRLALYRIYQHAVSNVLRHAEARKLSVRFAFDSEKVLLEVSDDGCGFEVPRRWIELARQGHMGLVGTAERVDAVGGHLEIHSTPGNGTTIRVSVPRQEGRDIIYSRGLSSPTIGR